MMLEVGLPSEPRVTCFALVWFLSCMQTHMCVETAVLGEALTAVLAHKRLFLGVSDEVTMQVGVVRSFVVAFRTLVHLETTFMHFLHMVSEMTFCRVLLVTLFTGIFLPLLIVGLHVNV